MGLVACTSAQNPVTLSSIEQSGSQGVNCHLCDGESIGLVAAATLDSPELEEAFSAITNIIKLPRTQKERRPRVAAMMALRRLLTHTGNAEHLNLATSSYGQWCLQALRSSVRELRIAAG